MLLSLIVPAYNEVQRDLPARLKQVTTFLMNDLGDRFPEWELIVVDDGSLDDTAAIVGGLAANDPRLKLVRLPENRGKGAAIQAGIGAATGERVLLMDADLATPMEEITRLMEALESGADIAIGSRGLRESVLERRESRLREYCGRFFNLLVQALLLPGIWDTQCGFKLFRGPLARAAAPALSESRFAFDVELLYLCRAAGARIVEVPIRWSHQPQSRVDLVGDGFSMMQGLFRTWLRKRRGDLARIAAMVRTRWTASEVSPLSPASPCELPGEDYPEDRPGAAP